MTRVALREFATGNPLYGGAQVSVLALEGGGSAERPVELFAARAGPQPLPNPQTLTAAGAWQQPVYVEEDYQLAIEGAGFARHITAGTRIPLQDIEPDENFATDKTGSLLKLGLVTPFTPLEKSRLNLLYAALASSSPDTVYTLAATEPAAPTGGETEEYHSPQGWSRTPPRATQTLSIWAAERSRTYVSALFVSASAWENVHEVTFRSGVMPAWTSTEGPAALWRSGRAISTLTVPEATGTPAPSYTASGLPAGLSFNATSREITGTPAAAGSGRAAITAANALGSAVWTLAWTVLPVGLTETVLSGVVGPALNPDILRLVGFHDNPANPQLPEVVIEGGAVAYCTNLFLRKSGAPTDTPTVQMWLHAANEGPPGPEEGGPEFTAGIRAGVTLALETATDSVSVDGIGDVSEPYSWEPANADDVATFADTLSPGDIVTLILRYQNTSFDVDHVWLLSATEPPIPVGGETVEEHTPADWSRERPDPTATQGVWRAERLRHYLAGEFDRADAWGNVVETAPADGSVVGFASPTGNTALWRSGRAISTLTVPEATGTPAPSYTASGLPAGLSFNATSREITGTPAAAGSGRAAITAANTLGSAVWTLAWTVLPASGSSETVLGGSVRRDSLGSGADNPFKRVRIVFHSDPLNPQLPADVIQNRADAYCSEIELPYLANPDSLRRVSMYLTPRNDGIGHPIAGPAFMPAIANTVAIAFAAGANTVTIAGIVGDAHEPYTWEPFNLAAVMTFAETLENGDTVAVTLDYDAVTTDTDEIWRASASEPAAPTGGEAVEEHEPGDWHRDRADAPATATENVYRARRTRYYVSGVFNAAGPWGAVARIADKTGAIAYDTDEIWRASASEPAAPTGGEAVEEHEPSDWHRDRADAPATATENVYRARRTRTYTDGAFTSATPWAGVRLVENRTAPVRDSDHVWRLSASEPAAPTGGETVEEHRPSGWLRTRPDPTPTQGVWRAQRTRTYTDGAFTSATSWAGVATADDGASGIFWKETGFFNPDYKNTPGNAEETYVTPIGRSLSVDGALPADIVEGGGTAYVTRLRLRENGTAQLHIQPTNDDDIRHSQAGHDLTAAAETDVRVAVKFRNHEVAFALPAVAAGEPYHGSVTNEADLTAWVRAVLAEPDLETAGFTVALLNDATASPLDLDTLTVTPGGASVFDGVALAAGRTGTEDEDFIYAASATELAAPTGGRLVEEHEPDGWDRSQPPATATENVYRAQRTRYYVSGVFTYAEAWDGVTLVANKTGVTDYAAPSFPSRRGATMRWTAGRAISTLTVPEATGTPAPSYTASGLPAGLSFNATSREITGTPTSPGEGTSTATITATNTDTVTGDSNTDTWKFDYRIAALGTLLPETVLLLVDEGGSETLGVGLSAEPSGTVTVTPTVTGGGGVTASPASLSFDASDWQTAKDFTVSAAADADMANETVVIVLAPSGGGYGGSSEVAVYVRDDDATAISQGPTDPLPDRPPSENYGWNTWPSNRVPGRVFNWSNATGTFATDWRDQDDEFTGPLDAESMADMRGAFASWERYLNCSFNEVADAADNEVRVGFGPAGGNIAYVQPSNEDDRLALVINRSRIDNTYSGLPPWRHRTFEHEVGHVLGLAHPDDVGGGDPGDSIMETIGNSQAIQFDLALGDIIGGMHMYGSAARAPAVGPDAPTVTVAATALKNTISWLAPAITGGLPATRFQVMIEDEDGSRTIVDTTGRLHEHSGLAAGAVWRYRAREFNAAGPGLWSAPQRRYVLDGTGAAPDAAGTVAWTDPAIGRRSALGRYIGKSIDGGGTQLPSRWIEEGGEAWVYSIWVNENTGGVTVNLLDRPTDRRKTAYPARHAAASAAGPNLRAEVAAGLVMELAAGSDTLAVTGFDDDLGEEPYILTRLPNKTAAAAWAARRSPGDTVRVKMVYAPLGMLVLSAGSLDIDEGGNKSFTIKLSRKPDGAVTVAVSEDSVAIAAAPSSLIFTTENWNDAQRVTVSARTDDDSEDETATVALAASGGGYNGVAASVAVTVVETGIAPPPGAPLAPTGISADASKLLPSGSRTFRFYADDRNPALPAGAIEDGETAFMGQIHLPTSAARLQYVSMNLIPSNSATSFSGGQEFTSAVEASIRMRFATATRAVVLSGIGDDTEPYTWQPANLAELLAFTDVLVDGERVAVGLYYTGASTDTDTVWRRSAADPGAPPGGLGVEEHEPSGWLRTRPDPTPTQGVWRAQRTRLYLNDEFESATHWRDPEVAAQMTGQIVTIGEDEIWLLSATEPPIPVGGETVEEHTPGDWSRTRPDPTATENVYRVRRTRTYTDGAFTSATPWAGVTKVANATGTVPSLPVPTGVGASANYLRAAQTTASHFVTFEVDDNTSFSSPQSYYDTVRSGVHIEDWTPPASGPVYVRARFTTGSRDGGTRGPWSPIHTYRGVSTLPDASAPTVTIDAVDTVAGNATQTLHARVSGGTYDDLEYAWEVSSGVGAVSGTGASVTYDPGNPEEDGNVAVQCTVTARGTGTVARAGSSDTDTDTEAFSVQAVQPPPPTPPAPPPPPAPPRPAGVTWLVGEFLYASPTTPEAYYATFQVDDNRGFVSPRSYYDTLLSSRHTVRLTPPASGPVYVRARFTTGSRDGGTRGPWSSIHTYRGA